MDMQVTVLGKILAGLGPRFDSASDKHDADDSFVSENYLALKERRVFSTLVPHEPGV